MCNVWSVDGGYVDGDDMMMMMVVAMVVAKKRAKLGKEMEGGKNGGCTSVPVLSLTKRYTYTY